MTWREYGYCFFSFSFIFWPKLYQFLLERQIAVSFEFLHCELFLRRRIQTFFSSRLLTTSSKFDFHQTLKRTKFEPLNACVLIRGLPHTKKNKHKNSIHEKNCTCISFIHSYALFYILLCLCRDAFDCQFSRLSRLSTEDCHLTKLDLNYYKMDWNFQGLT